MSQKIDVEVTTADGTCPAVMVTPDGAGPWPAVIVFQDAGGMRPQLITLCEDIAAMGYVAFLPDMYYRHGQWEPFDFPAIIRREPEAFAYLQKMGYSVTRLMAIADTGPFLDFLSSRPEVAGTKFGCTGYCMGGALALAAAAGHPDRIAAAGSFHGSSLASDLPDSPHRLVGTIKGRVYMAAADNDPLFPPEQAELLETALQDAGVEYTLETYPDTRHGFAIPGGNSHNAEAYARHLDALRDLFGSTLK
jgi:carboxymethylenebutenolidase